MRPFTTKFPISFQSAPRSEGLRALYLQAARGGQLHMAVTWAEMDTAKGNGYQQR